MGGEPQQQMSVIIIGLQVEEMGEKGGLVSITYKQPTDHRVMCYLFTALPEQSEEFVVKQTR